MTRPRIPILAGSSTLSANVVCGNGQNLELAELAEPTVEDDNTICPDDAPE